MIEVVITGGQSGADLAGWVAAKAAGLVTTGAMGAGFMTEDGPRPEYAELYGAYEIDGGYADRRRENIDDADGCLLFGDPGSNGGRGLIKDARVFRKPVLIVRAGVTKPSDAVAFLRLNGIMRLMVAGNRASTDPKLGPKVERFLAAVFRMTATPTGEGS